MVGKTILRDAALLLDHNQRNIVSRWTQRAVRIESMGGHQELHLQELVGAVPLLLVALSAALRSGDLEKSFQRPADGWAKARTHARVRAEQGFSLGEVLLEFQLLRSEIWHAFSLELSEMHPAVGDVLLLGQQLDYALDALLAATIQAWCELKGIEGFAK